MVGLMTDTLNWAELFARFKSVSKAEAEAMLNTWKASYFQKPGLRLFYIVPRAWTDYFLPLEFSVPARVTRVIVGRVDLH